jgi:hypothetical protein
MLPLCRRKASAIIRRSTSASASANVPAPCKFDDDGIVAIDAAEGAVGDDVRFNSVESCSGVITPPS